MGLLDDAIREHLELKRRHGAPAEEVQRQEHEALGPIRRRGEPEPDVLADPPPDADREVATDPDLAAVPAHPAPGEPLADPVVETPADPEIAVPEEATAIIPPPPVLPASEQPVMPEPAGHEPVIEDFPAADGPAAVPDTDSGARRAPSFVDDDPWLDDSPEAPPADVLEPPGQSTTAFTAADVAEAAGEPQPLEEDVLEETPDFLQETPEHDRLWFEQRPPRGFDFEQ